MKQPDVGGGAAKRPECIETQLCKPETLAVAVIALFGNGSLGRRQIGRKRKHET
jgi:hypothetical protein